jgi:hypothetical protein
MCVYVNMYITHTFRASLQNDATVMAVLYMCVCVCMYALLLQNDANVMDVWCVCMYTCMHVYAYTHTPIHHVHTHVHTHTHTHNEEIRDTPQSTEFNQITCVVDSHISMYMHTYKHHITMCIHTYTSIQVCVSYGVPTTAYAHIIMKKFTTCSRALNSTR